MSSPGWPRSRPRCGAWRRWSRARRRRRSVFAAVAEEVGRLLGADMANVCRYEADETVTIVASGGGSGLPVRHPVAAWGETNIATLVFETGRPARIDNYADATGPLADGSASSGIRSAVGAPIVVEGRLWGVMAAARPRRSRCRRTPRRASRSFTELVATAISNTEARTEVAASRARIVAATDEERRRVVRDLHDGAQQRLVHTSSRSSWRAGARERRGRRRPRS